MQAIATLGRQLVDGHRGPVELIGFYAVMQASPGPQDSRPTSILIGCYGAKRTVEEEDLIMAEWRRQRPTNAVLPGGRGASTKHSSKSKVGSVGTGDASSGSEGMYTSGHPELFINGAEQL